MGQSKERLAAPQMNAAEVATAQRDVQRMAEVYKNAENIRTVQVTGPASGLAATLRTRDPLVDMYLNGRLTGGKPVF